MSHQTRTPRAPVGDGLVPLVTRVTPEDLAWLKEEAAQAECSLAEVVRDAIGHYIDLLDGT